jgi:transglutaminase-like putative cysteine protease
MERRTFLKSIGVPAAATIVGIPARIGLAAAAETSRGWRTFEVTTRAEVVDPSGTTRVWLPLPLATETDWHKPLGNSWKGNAPVMRDHRDDKYGATLLFVEWPSGEKAPVVEVVSRFSTRDRNVDLGKPPTSPAKESPATLKTYTAATKLMPLDGVVLETSREIVQGAGSDLEKARAIYEWIVENTFRDPKVRGCGVGDIRGMLETKNLGGKCADLNALFVGLARAAGIPARDLYGIRAAESREFKSLGKSGDITRAQHCRAEFYAQSHGWVPVDPADVRKVILEEKPGLTLDDPIAKRARAKLFGQWEMNYLPYNFAHDLKLPSAAGDPVAFLMYPQAETAEGRKDPLEPAAFKYEITSKEV